MNVSDGEIEAAARAICKARDLDPDTLHQVFEGDPDDKQPEDGHFINSRGERCKMIRAWRKYVTVAALALEAAASSRPAAPTGTGWKTGWKLVPVRQTDEMMDAFNGGPKLQQRQYLICDVFGAVGIYAPEGSPALRALEALHNAVDAYTQPQSSAAPDSGAVTYNSAVLLAGMLRGKGLLRDREYAQITHEELQSTVNQWLGALSPPSPPAMPGVVKALDEANGALWPFAKLELGPNQIGSEFFVTCGEIENAKAAYTTTRAALASITRDGGGE